MIDITIKNFETELIQASARAPVLLDIWAPWCGPCKTLSPVLEKLEREYAGRFTLAKLNSDEQPEIAGQLSQAFGVRSIPFCVLFDQGQPVDGFVGAQPEAQIRQFLDRHVPSSEDAQADAQAEEAEALEAGGDTEAALAKLQQAVAVAPGNDAARCDYVKLLIELKRLQQARVAYEPIAGKAPLDGRIAALGLWLEACEKAPSLPGADALRAAIAANKRDFDSRYRLAQGHFAAGRFTDAMDELLEIVMRDKQWNEQLARRTYVAILEVMSKPAPKAAPEAAKGTLEVTSRPTAAPSDPVVDQYRRKLSMALF
ncbi:MAG: putative protein YbbN [Burkholderiaceae bacterium]|nr:putative protein YbbN [Burkholderiaceae bacterium]